MSKPFTDLMEVQAKGMAIDLIAKARPGSKLRDHLAYLHSLHITISEVQREIFEEAGIQYPTSIPEESQQILADERLMVVIVALQKASTQIGEADDYIPMCVAEHLTKKVH